MGKPALRCRRPPTVMSPSSQQQGRKVGGLQCPDKAPDPCSLLRSRPACLNRHYPANPTRRELIRAGRARHKASSDLEAAGLSLHKNMPSLVSPPRSGRYAPRGASSGVRGPLFQFIHKPRDGSLAGEGATAHARNPACSGCVLTLHVARSPKRIGEMRTPPKVTLKKVSQPLSCLLDDCST